MGLGIAKGVLSYMKRNPVNTLFGVGSLPFSVDDYEERRANGNGVVSSGLGAAFETVLPFVTSIPGYIAYEALAHAGDIARGINDLDSYRRNLGRAKHAAAFSNSQFNDTEQAHTMRQAGMAMMQKSKYNAQVALMGNEAKYMYK